MNVGSSKSIQHKAYRNVKADIEESFQKRVQTI